MVDPLHVFSPKDRERIAGAVAAAQAGTRAKFAFVAVKASDHYAWFPVVWAAIISLAATGVLSLARPELPIGAGFVINAAAFVVLTLVFDIWPLRVALVPERFKRIALHSAAWRAYAAHLISKDEEDNGVMLFVSLAERHLEIVAEREAHARAPEGSWERIVADSTRAMRRLGVADGLVQAIQGCAGELARAFPR